MSKKGKVSREVHAQKEVKEVKPSTTSFFNMKDWGTISAILFLTLLVFAPLKKYQFVNWDDDKNFYENELITTLNKGNFWKNSKEIFKIENNVIGGYNPLVIWSFAVEKRIHGSKPYDGLNDPGSWHLTNILLHMIAVFFAYLIARRLSLSLLASAFVALLFAIQPMRVESVAWVTERKDVLFGAFYLAALYQYIRYKQNPGIIRLITIFILFILSLYSKIQAVSLPLSMIAVDYLLDKKISISVILKKWPYFILSMIFGIIGIMVLKDQGSLETNTTTFPFWQRLFIGSYSFIIYLIKAIIPFRMSPLYPYPSSIPPLFYATFGIFPITAFALWKAYQKQWHVFVFSFLFFIVNIVFLLQILGAGQGYLADRFTYIAYFGLFFGMGYALDKFLNKPALKIPAIGVASLLCIAYIFITSSQIKIWENSGSLWTHVLKYYDKTTLPFGNRANFYRDKKMYNEALADYASAIALQPGPQTFNSRARLYFDTAGNDRATLEKALSDYNEAIKLSPKDGEFWINRGATYARLGDIKTALENIDQGLQFKPDHASGYLNRFVLNSQMASTQIPGTPEFVDFSTKAIRDIEAYQKFKPYESDLYYEKARVKRGLGKLDEALSDVNTAIQFNNSKGLYFYERSIIHSQLGKNGEAKVDLTNAINLKYDNIDPAYRQRILGN